MKNCIIAQSGGPTVAINASIVGIMEQNNRTHTYHTIYGAINGIAGVIDKSLTNLTERADENPDFLDMLFYTPAMYLGSCRYKLPDAEKDNGVYQQIFDVFSAYDIDTFFYIGGNDSMDTVDKLSKYAKMIESPVKILGIPKTIDNDLLHTDHTPGFGSAAKYVAASLLEVAHDTLIYHMKSVTIVEIMGRDAGWLTAASALARNDYSAAPHLIYLPERPFSVRQFLTDVHTLLDRQDNVVIAVSEGIRNEKGEYISAGASTSDNFGHTQLSGAGKALELLLIEAYNIKVRSIEINILQRAAGHLSSLCDLNEAKALGAHAVSCAEDGMSGFMMVLQRSSDQPYTTSCDSFPVDKIANGIKTVPDHFIHPDGNDVTDEMLSYLRPLIAGEPKVRFKDGLPEYLDVRHLIRKI